MSRRHLVWRTLFALVLLTLTACSDPSFVEEIKVVNEGDFPADVEVSDGDRTDWLALGLVEAASERSFQQVIDQGETWIFRFGYLEEHREEVEISRATLEQEDWAVTVPPEFESALRAKGHSPPP